MERPDAPRRGRLCAARDPTTSPAAPATPESPTTSATPAVGSRATSELGYFTLTTPDVDLAAAFYGALFGWVAEASTPTQDGQHRYRHVANTTLPFGFVDNPGSPSPDHYYRVDDLPAMVARVRDLGGEVISVDEYESGGNAVCKDDQGTVFQLWQPAPGY